MSRGMRALTAVTIFMGVLIVVGTGALIAVIVHRSTAPSPPPPPPGPVAVHLAAPAGTHIAAIAGAGDRLAVELQGGGTDRVVLVDPHTGKVTGQITLGTQ